MNVIATEKTVLSLLAKLGPTSDEIAATLEAEGVKGRPYCPTSCPVAVYLKNKLPDNLKVGGGTDGVCRGVC